MSGFTPRSVSGFDDPKMVMTSFRDWLASQCKGRCLFVSDNNGFDWQFINWYFHHFLGRTRSASPREPGIALQGAGRRTRLSSFKHLRRTGTRIIPVDDARGNAEALLSDEGDMASRSVSLDARMSKSLGRQVPVSRMKHTLRVSLLATQLPEITACPRS